MRTEPSTDFQDEEETKPGKLSAIKLEVTVDGVAVEVDTQDGEERRILLQSLLRQFRSGTGHEFLVKYDGKVVCSSSKVYLAPSECNSVYCLFS